MENDLRNSEANTGPDREGYRSFLLRCWREAGPTGGYTWRFRLQPVTGGEQWGFRDLRAVFQHVSRVLPAGFEEPGVNSEKKENPPAEKHEA